MEKRILEQGLEGVTVTVSRPNKGQTVGMSKQTGLCTKAASSRILRADRNCF